MNRFYLGIAIICIFLSAQMPLLAAPASTEELQAQIRALQSQLAALIAQLNELQSESVSPYDPVRIATQDARNALVNILCVRRERDSTIRVFSGSGVIVDPSGIILTNAHVLITNIRNGVLNDCVVRRGNPAKEMYTTRLEYLSPLWLEEHADTPIGDHQKGSGEHDIALLSIRTDQALPYLPISTHTPGSKEAVVAASYPAEFLLPKNIDIDLYVTTDITRVEKVYTFGDKERDIFVTSPSFLAQQGSSGGALVDSGGNLIGLIVSSSNAPTVTERNIAALTMSHIDREIRATENMSFEAFLKKLSK